VVYSSGQVLIAGEHSHLLSTEHYCLANEGYWPKGHAVLILGLAGALQNFT